MSGFRLPYSALLDTLSKHWYVEACRHAFAIRMSLSDPKFDHGVSSDAIKDLIEGDYMEMLRQKTLDDGVLKLSEYGGHRWAQLNDTDDKGALIDAKEGDRRRRRTAERQLRLFNYLEDHGTTSLSVVDKDRNTVSITSSINLEVRSVFSLYKIAFTDEHYLLTSCLTSLRSLVLRLYHLPLALYSTIKW